MTWNDIRLATLQKMFSAQGNTIPNDDATNEYLAAMPQAANEALNLLCLSSKFTRKSVDVVQASDEDAQSWNFYDVSALANDFYSLGEPEIYLLNGSVMTTVRGAMIRAGKYLSVDPRIGGTLRIFYNAWPEKITKDTIETYELPLEQDVAVLLPLYMASQLYKDDDLALATMYRNEFETARGELRPKESGTRSDTFYDEGGWI